MLPLKTTLFVNGISSAAAGLGLVVLSGEIAALFNVSQPVIITAIGWFLLAFGLFVTLTGAAKNTSVPLVRLITFLDISWVVASIITIFIAPLSVIGTIATLAVAGWVGMMAILQSKGMKVTGKVKQPSKLAAAAILVLVLSGRAVAQGPSASDVPPVMAVAFTHQPASADPVAVATAFLNAVQQKDHAVAIGLLDEQVQWQQPGNNRFSGHKQNRNEVVALFKGFHELSASTLQLVHISTIAVNGNQVACLLRWKAVQPTGKVLEVDNVDVYTIEAGKIKKAVVFSADERKEDDFWGK